MNLKLTGLTKQDMLHLAELPSLSERRKKMEQFNESAKTREKSQSTELSEGDFVYTCDGNLGLIRAKEPHYFKVIIIGSYATATYGHSAVEKIMLDERTKGVLDKFLAEDLAAVKGGAISVTPTKKPRKRERFTIGDVVVANWGETFTVGVITSYLPDLDRVRIKDDILTEYQPAYYQLRMASEHEKDRFHASRAEYLAKLKASQSTETKLHGPGDPFIVS